MNKLYKLLMAGSALLVVAAGTYFTIHSDASYSPRSKATEAEQGINGTFEYYQSLKKNQITGRVDLGDILAVKASLASQKLNKAGGLPLNWEATGPDNIGGRCRALLVDRNDPNILYAGGVSGGLWKSTNKGASWVAINDGQENLSVVSICQSSDGTIYYGTGESSLNGLWQSDGEEYSSFTGDGIFKSTDGKTFTQLSTTKGFNAVSSMAVNPIDNVIYAGTDQGLYYSDNAGTTWTRVLQGNCREVKISSSGVILAYVGNLLWRAATNGKLQASYVRSNGLPGSARMAMAFSPQDPNYAYAFVAGNVSISTTGGTITVGSGLVGVYQSTNGGVDFNQIIGKESQYFAPLTHLSLGSSQGTYDLVIAVHPRDKERIFMGGINWAEWDPVSGPRIVGNTFDSPVNPLGIHADKHAITFDTVSNPMIMYIGSDGGVAKTTNAAMTNYTAINTGFVTTQYYGIAASTTGSVIGGTQDNNSILIDRKGSTRQRGTAILGGDGFRCEISKINPNIYFYESQYGGMVRSMNAGGSASEIWDNRITASHASKNYADSIFNTPMRLWEDESTGKGRLYFGMNNSVWMARGVIESGAEIRWFKVANISGNPHIIEATKDGKHLFVATLGGVIVRVDGLDRANFDTTEIVSYSGISDSLTTLSVRGNMPSGRAITDIEIDDNNPNRVIVTMGNYGNTNYIYVTENALDAVPTWRSLQGSGTTQLPLFPVYDVEIYEKNPDLLIVGTEFGVWATTNGQAASPSWTEQNNTKFPRVAVYEMRQVSEKSWTGPVLYAGTHGRGIFETRNLLTSTKNIKSPALGFKVFPNPANSETKLQFSTRSAGLVTLSVYSISGQMVHSQQHSVANGTNSLSIETASFKNGIYIAKMEGSTEGQVKFIVQH